MFDRLFADYLVKTGRLNCDQLDRIYQDQQKKYVRLGVIAVSEKLMTVEEVEEVNQLQALYDKRFGDIAVSEGYLNEEQVSRLLALQGNPFLTFMQAAIDSDIIGAGEFDDLLKEFQKENNFTLMNIEEMKSCQVDRIVPIFVYKEPELVKKLCGVMIRTVSRLIDNHVFIRKPYVEKSVDFEALARQELNGDHHILTAIAGDADDGMMKVAVAFAGAENVSDRDDSLDALCELINCVNGLLATEASNDDVDVDMDAPMAEGNKGKVRGENVLVLPFVACGREFKMLITYDEDYEVVVG
ncbi:MAG: hypothetical protein K6E68_09150 [Lachnospiraceae bacterium]|nr:hypothetical protein [Lachnospiraceae bacterium]